MNEEVTLDEIEFDFQCMIDNSIEPMQIGAYRFAASVVLKKCDPVAYRQEVGDFINQLLDDEEIYEFNNRYFREPQHITYLLRKLEIAKY